MPWNPEELPRSSEDIKGLQPGPQGMVDKTEGSWFNPFSVHVGGGFVPSLWTSECVDNIQAKIHGEVNIPVQKAEEKLINLEKEAYKRGFMKGWSEAYQEEQNRIENTLDLLERVTQELSCMKKNVLEEAEGEILELALAISRKAVLEEINLNRELVMNSVRAAVRKISAAGDLRIRVNPKDLALVEEHRPELLELRDGEGEVVFIKDAQVDPGGCVVESDHQIVEYHPGQQIEAIRRRVLKKKEDSL
jgi:flagellar biosynthesis/type III secretory pathway protein FliH